MNHNRRQHGGWASQAQRRNEVFVRCNTCGGPAHPRSYTVVEERERELTWVALVIGSVATFFLLYAFWIALAVLA